MNSLPRIVVLISGNGSNLQALIDASLSGRLGGRIVQVISNRASANGLQRAQNANIKTSVVKFASFKTHSKPKLAYDAALVQVVNECHPDLVILAGFMRILTPVFLGGVCAPVFNLHPALPQCYTGLNAMERAWNDFESNRITHSGVMVHEVIEAVDMGPVIGFRKVPMSPYATFEQFKSAMHQAEHALLVQVVQKWCTTFAEP